MGLFSSGPEFIITGSRELDKKFSEMPKRLQNNHMRKATRAAAKAVLVHAQRLVPEDTGALAASLKVRSAAMTTTTSGGTRRRIRKYRGMIGHGVSTTEGLFKGKQFYAGFVEFGTKTRTTKAGANRGLIESGKWAFLRPALYAEEDKTRQIFKTEMVRFIAEEAVTKK